MADWLDEVEFETAPQPAAPAATPAAEPVAPDWRDDVQFETEPPSSPGTAIGTFGQGVTAGAVKGGAMVASAFAGGKLGAAAGLLGGPAAPVTVPFGAGVGAIAGAGIGLMAGGELQRWLAKVEMPWSGETMTFETIQAVPKHLRPYAVAGETLGGSIPFAAAPYMLARDGIKFAPNLVGRFFNRITESAATMPKQFALAELGMATGAATGAGGAEAIFPGNSWARAGGEVVGGIANPARWTMTIAGVTFQRARTLYQSFTPTGRQDKAAGIVQQILRDFGEDPIAVAEQIKREAAKFPTLRLTAGQMADSPALLALEGKLAAESAKYGSESRRMAQQSMESLRVVIGALESSGDTQALRVAAQMRSDYFDGLLATRVHVAEQQALEAAAHIAPNNPISRADFGKKAAQIIGDAMSDVRAVETNLYSKVDKKIPATADEILSGYDKIRSERLPEESLPPLVEAFVRRMRGQPEPSGLPDDVTRMIRETFSSEPPPATAIPNMPTTSGELILFRSRMLELARTAAGKNEWSDARVYGELAESALDDLAKITEVTPAFTEARAWSRQLHDAFSRTFAGDVLEKTSAGARRIPPELVMARAFATGREVGELQFRQLEEAAKLAGQEHLTRMLDVQERTLRSAAAETIDTVTGRVNPNRLAKFREKNAELLNRFEELKPVFENAETAERAFRATEAGVGRARKAIESQAAFAKILGVEDPTMAVGRVIRGEFPVRDFGAIAKLAQRSGPDAVDGFKSAIFADAYEQARRVGGEFSWSAYADAMLNPVRTGGPSTLTLMKNSGVIRPDEAALVIRFLGRAKQIETAVARGDKLETVLSAEDALLDGVLRIFGSSAAKIAPTGGAHPLIVASAGSRLARQVFDKVPQLRLRTMIEEISKDPKTMAALLERPVSPADKIRIARQINAFLWQAGLIQTNED